MARSPLWRHAISRRPRIARKALRAGPLVERTRTLYVQTSKEKRLLCQATVRQLARRGSGRCWRRGAVRLWWTDGEILRPGSAQRLITKTRPVSVTRVTTRR